MQTRPRAKFYQQMTAIGAMTINEVRSLENYPPVGRDVMTTANTIRAHSSTSIKIIRRLTQILGLMRPMYRSVVKKPKMFNSIWLLRTARQDA